MFFKKNRFSNLKEKTTTKKKIRIRKPRSFTLFFFVVFLEKERKTKSKSG